MRNLPYLPLIKQALGEHNSTATQPHSEANMKQHDGEGWTWGRRMPDLHTWLVSAPDQREELISGFGVLAENTQHSARHRFTVHLLHTSHHHTHVTMCVREREDNTNIN